MVRALRALDDDLDDADLEPDAARTGWNDRRAVVEALRARLETEVLTPVDAAVAALDASEADSLRRAVAHVTARAAVLVDAAGDQAAGWRLLQRAAQIVPEAAVLRAELQAALRQADAYALLVRARWRLRRGDIAGGDALLRPLARGKTEPALKAAARRLLDGPRPISAAPPLFRLNGFGVGLYGERDQQADGSYVATYCVSALWIPVFPLTAYRVIAQGDRRYLFLAREKLSPLARLCRSVVMVGAALAVGGFWLSSWLDDPARRATSALADASALEARGDPAGALSAYDEALRAYGETVDGAALAPAAEAVVRLGAAAIAEPFTPEAVDAAARLVLRFEGMPETARAGAAAAALTGDLERWAGQLGDADAARTNAGLRVLDLAARIAEGGDRDRVVARGVTLRRALAARLAPDWPLEALHHYALLGDDPAAVEGAAAILRTFGEVPALWLEAEPDVTKWASVASAHDTLVPAVEDARAKLDAAHRLADDAERTAALESGDKDRLGAALRRLPGDHEVAVALAGALRARGDTSGAIALLTGLGPPGRLSGEARLALGMAYAEAERLDDADTLLSRYVETRLAPFSEARRVYEEAYDATREALINSADMGGLPEDVRRKVEGAGGGLGAGGPGEAEAREALTSWLTSSLEADARLTALRAEYQRYGDVVAAALALGTVKLRRAGATSGETRAKLLGEAERVLLSIRAEAEGTPEFHLGLGKVYHRLGKTEDGERELKALLDRGEPETSLAVAGAYRELGLETRARAVAESVWDSAPSPVKEEAATLRAVMGDDDADRRTWYERGDEKSEYVRRSLMEIDARGLYREGKRADADALYARIAAEYAKEAAHDASAANNAALQMKARYVCTGDPTHLDKAVSLLEAALRLAPDNSLVAGNLAGLHEYRADLRVLERWVRPRVLRLDSDDASRLFTTLASGDEREALLSARREDPAFRRALDVTRSEEVLAPRRTAGYERELGWYADAGDVAALGALAAKVGAAGALDTGGLVEIRRAFVAGESDARIRAELDTAVHWLEEAVEDAAHSGHKPTLAAAKTLLAFRLGQRALIGGGLADAAAAVTALRDADRAWPSCGARGELAWALVEQAVWKAAATAPALAHAMAADFRTYNMSTLLDRLLGGSDGAAVREALRAQAELAEAAALRKTDLAGGRPPDVADWVLARLVGDADYERAAAAAFAREDARLVLEIGVLLAPGEGGDAALALFRRGPR
jgi:hypothetical protein